MPLTEPTSAVGQAGLHAVIDAPQNTMVAVDFDGTLAPIVDNPEEAYGDERAVAALARLGGLIGMVAIITGRPAQTAVRLGRLREHESLRQMVVLGQYGIERWNASADEFVVPPEPAAISALADELPELLASLGFGAARIEHKGRAIGVHTRELPSPAEAFRRLYQPLGDLAARHGLHLEPGRNVLEIRAPGMDKGEALADLIDETGVQQVIFAGDDLGDLPAFRMVAARRDRGHAGLLVCSASHEEDALAVISDVVVEGPAGVAVWLDALADAIEARQA